MLVKGTKENVDSAVILLCNNKLNPDDKPKIAGSVLCGIFGTSVIENCEYSDGEYSAEIVGESEAFPSDCILAESNFLRTCIDNKSIDINTVTTLDSVSSMLQLKIEIFSQNFDNTMQEHLIINRGLVTKNERDMCDIYSLSQVLNNPIIRADFLEHLLVSFIDLPTPRRNVTYREIMKPSFYKSFFENNLTIRFNCFGNNDFTIDK